MHPDWELNPQPGFVLWQGIRPVTFWCTERCSNHLLHTGQGLSFLSVLTTRPHLLFFSSCLGRFTRMPFSFKSPFKVFILLFLIFSLRQRWWTLLGTRYCWLLGVVDGLITMWVCQGKGGLICHRDRILIVRKRKVPLTAMIFHDGHDPPTHGCYTITELFHNIPGP